MNCLSHWVPLLFTSPAGCVRHRQNLSISAAQELKYLDASVELIAHVNAVVLVDKNPTRDLELSRLNARRAHEHAHVAVGRENLEVIESRVGNPDVALVVEGDSLGA